MQHDGGGTISHTGVAVRRQMSGWVMAIYENGEFSVCPNDGMAAHGYVTIIFYGGGR